MDATTVQRIFADILMPEGYVVSHARGVETRTRGCDVVEIKALPDDRDVVLYLTARVRLSPNRLGDIPAEPARKLADLAVTVDGRPTCLSEILRANARDVDFCARLLGWALGDDPELRVENTTVQREANRRVR